MKFDLVAAPDQLKVVAVVPVGRKAMPLASLQEDADAFFERQMERRRHYESALAERGIAPFAAKEKDDAEMWALYARTIAITNRI